MFYQFIRFLLFKLDPETSHDVALQALNFFYRLGLVKKSTISSPKKVMGINFPNPIGLAAGLDKDGEYIQALAALGFGFIEVGTVTPKAQKGNPKPRLFRINKLSAIINRMGFNNKGVSFLVEELQTIKFSGVLGINIGKNATTPIENAANDYIYCMQQVYPYASYIAVNISSPNTVDLRKLQYGEHLENLLSLLKAEQKTLADKFQRYVPLVIKISPDLTAQEIETIAESLLKYQIDGVIATNTTLSREEIKGYENANEQGGLSGQPLMHKSTQVVQQLHKILQGEIPIIAVGGITTAEDAKAKIAAGADLVQIYTGFIYQGPKLIKDIAKEMVSPRASAKRRSS